MNQRQKKKRVPVRLKRKHARFTYPSWRFPKWPRNVLAKARPCPIIAHLWRKFFCVRQQPRIQ